MASEPASGRAAGHHTRPGWAPLRKPPRGAVGQSPFSRLAIAHCTGMAGDTLVTMALAGSLFFSISPSAARGRVAAYLLLTMAPFAVVAPVLGPALDRSRGGRRTMMILAAASRALVSLSMANHLNTHWIFPEAFALLVLSKAQMITKSALVPSTVASEAELVEANSRLAVLSVIAGFVAAVPGVIILKIGILGAPWVLRLAAVAFAGAAVASLRLARPAQAKEPIEAPAAEKAELHATSIRLSATAMAVLRAVVGFMTFLVAFDFRHRGAPAWWFGVVLAASMFGNFVGAVGAPWLRRRVAEERILLGALALVTVAGFFAARTGGSLGAIATLAGVIGVSAGAGKLAFDSIVQRDAPDAVRGRTFARFETRFQLVWVLGAALPVILRVPATTGMDLVAAAAAVAFASYVGGLAASHRRG